MPENYFNYFTEIEERFQKRRGSMLLLSTLDWALIETWKNAGIPLEAVLRGIDSAFDTYDRKPPRAKTRKVNSLAYCSQEVLAAAEGITEASVGSVRRAPDPSLEKSELANYLKKNAGLLSEATAVASLKKFLEETSATLGELGEAVAGGNGPSPEEIERHLTVLEEKMFATLLTATADTELVAVRSEADRDIAPYRSKMSAAQIEQLHRQYVNKRLLERAKLPRLSLFYM
ncbi:MAG TPA: hypothetical protein VM056_03470 [Terriglobales bacterium]|nr:hypothetical protein [Terriglobales bacterium]